MNHLEQHRREVFSLNKINDNITWELVGYKIPFNLVFSYRAKGWTPGSNVEGERARHRLRATVLGRLPNIANSAGLRTKIQEPANAVKTPGGSVPVPIVILGNNTFSDSWPFGVLKSEGFTDFDRSFKVEIELGAQFLKQNPMMHIHANTSYGSVLEQIGRNLPKQIEDSSSTYISANKPGSGSNPGGCAGLFVLLVFILLLIVW